VRAASGALFLAGAPALADAQTRRPIKIGVIGSGNIGGTIGKLWAKAGHEILFASRNPSELAGLVAEAGPKARAGTPMEAASFGPVVFLAVPYAAVPQIGRDFGAALKGKVLIDCSNPIAGRDGEMANAARQKGAGVATQEFIPTARVTRAFGSVNFTLAAAQAHRAGPRMAIPIAGDNAAALRTTSNLVVDAGFDPVVVGGLATSKLFDYGAIGFNKNVTAPELRKILGL
jgi:8-hydroxy-5-deazaflavin:NADPH oxidoreductase